MTALVQTVIKIEKYINFHLVFLFNLQAPNFILNIFHESKICRIPEPKETVNPTHKITLTFYLTFYEIIDALLDLVINI